MKKARINLRKKTITITTIALLVLVSFVITALPSKADFVSGSATIYPSEDVKPCTNDTWTITYTIGKTGFNGSGLAINGEGINGGMINVTIPYNWSLPQITDPTSEGFVVVNTLFNSNIVIGEITVTGRNISVPVISGSNRGERIYIIYGEMSGGIGPGAQAQCYVQRGVEFTVWENPNMEPDNWRRLHSSPKLNVIDEISGIEGDINIETSQAIGVKEITFGTWPEADDSAVAAIAEDRLSYTIGLQLNNGDRYGDHGTNQWIKICLLSYAKTDMVVMLTTEFGITNPDPGDVPSDDIHIWYEAVEGQEDVIGQVDPWTYLIKIPATDGTSIGFSCFYMWVDVGNKVPPGFYQFETFIEPTNWDGSDGSFKTVNT